MPDAAPEVPTSAPTPSDDHDATLHPAAGGDDSPAEGRGAPDPADAPPSVFDSLREDYQAAVETDGGERSIDWEVLPARFHGNLGVRITPVDDEQRRKRTREARKRGTRGREAMLNNQAQLIADATATMLIRPKGGGEWVPMHEDPDTPVELRDAPIRFDANLCTILGIDYPGSSFGVVRLVFRGNPAALEDFAGWTDLWLKEELDTGTDEDDEEGGGRPT